MKNLLIIIALLSTTLSASQVLKKYVQEVKKMDFTKDTFGLMRNTKVYKNPSWVCKITLSSNKTYFFVSPKSMIEFYNNPSLRPDVGVKSEDDFKQILVTDFNTLKALNAKGAFYVYGANIISSAGDDLPAFSSYEEAEHFSKKHNGKRVMSFYEIPPALISLLNGKI